MRTSLIPTVVTLVLISSHPDNIEDFTGDCQSRLKESALSVVDVGFCLKVLSAKLFGTTWSGGKTDQMRTLFVRSMIVAIGILLMAITVLGQGAPAPARP